MSAGARSPDDDQEPEESWGAEEPWEAEVGALLGRLPMVEPPEGFLVGALDHRPLRGGRTLVGLVALVLIAVVAVVGADLVERTVVSARLDPVVAVLDAEGVRGSDGPNTDRPASVADHAAPKVGYFLGPCALAIGGACIDPALEHIRRGCLPLPSSNSCS